MTRFVFILVLVAPWLSAQTKAGPQRMEIVLERRDGDAWKTVDPGLVLEQNDRVRFRFHADFNGHLYVMNMSTSGTYSLLFPREETGRDNQIRAGREYLVPATQAWFRISGPPGHEIVYWMVTPTELRETVAPVPRPKKLPASMTPRCDDTLFRARGECIDTSAGPKGIVSRELLPDNLGSVAGQDATGDLMFMRQQNTAVVASPGPLKGPVIYEFHIAHK